MKRSKVFISGRSHTTAYGCSSTTFSVRGLPYSQVCGRIRGYQLGATSAFYLSSAGIDSYKSDIYGVAGSYQHVWTFAAGHGLTEMTSDHPSEHAMSL